MNTQAMLVANDPDYRGWLANSAGHAVALQIQVARGIEDVTATIAGGRRVEIVFCEFDRRNLASAVALVERLVESQPSLPVVGIATSDDAELVLAAMRAGARDFLVRGRDDATLAAQIGRLLRRSAAVVPPAAHRPGRVYGVLAAHPHESIAFVAEHLALALAESAAGARVLLLDIATPAGAAAIFLNLAQTYSVLNAIDDAHRCDDTLVDTAFTRHVSGLYVLSLPEDLPGRPHLDGAELLALLRVLSGLFAHTVVALDGQLPLSLVSGFAEQADRLVLLSDQSILKSRHNKHLLRALRAEGAALDRAGLVVDNYRRRIGLEPQNLAELFELPLLATLSSDSNTRQVSMNTGEPLYTVARKDPLWLGVQQLAQTLASGRALARAPAPHVGAAGLVKRLFAMGAS